MSGLDALFAPRSVAVLGVSRNPAKLGFRLLENVVTSGYEGRVYPVNPAGEPILELPSVPSVDGLPEGVDLALVSLPAPAVPEAIEKLARRRARAAVVLSSGFGEVDASGRDVESRLFATARAAGLRLVGPNCMGVYSAPARLNGTYFWDLPRVTGRIGVVSQSGAYGGLIFRHLGSRGLGVARFLSIGNQADVDIAEVIDYLADDPATSVIACFVEALRDGRRFVDVATRATATKPIVVLKGGRSDAGRRAAGSHTGSLAGTYDAYRAAFRRSGVVLAEETEDFFDAIEALAVSEHRPAAGRIAVITVSGGPSVVAADAAERAGLDVPALDDAARASLRALLPPFAAVGNPVDLTPQVDPSRIADAVGIVFDQPAIAGAVLVDVGLDIAALADAVVHASTRTGKPVTAFAADVPVVAERLGTAHVPIAPSPERAVRAWRALWTAAQRRPVVARPAASLRADVGALIAHERGVLSYEVARRVLEAVGVPFVRETITADVDEAVRAADTIGYPVVVKADARGLVHKSDVGGVRVGIADAASVRDACRDLRERVGAERFVVQQHAGRGVELLVGGRRDDVFGPIVAVGAGGVLTEVVRDVAVELAPVTPDDVAAMLADGARARLVAGPRGLPRVDVAALAPIVTAVGDLMLAAPRIREIDLNPVIAATRAVAVDAVMILE